MKKLKYLLLSIAVCMTSCVGNAEFSAYVKAHRMKYEAMSPVYRTYLMNDETIDEALRNTRLRLLEAELAMILAAEESLQVSTVPFPVPPAPPPGN